MSLSRLARTLGLYCGAVVVASVGAVGQSASNFAPQGSEYSIAGGLPGDQVHPQVSVNADGGYLVWEDNRTDGDGLGISALRLDGNFSAAYSPFRVNQEGAGDQQNAKVALLKDGGAVFVWQGGDESRQHIYARFLSASNTWVTGDIMVNSDTNHFQQDAAVSVLSDGVVVVVYSSLDEQGAGSMQDIFGQRFSLTGQKVGGTFPVNQFTTYNQRTPSVAALTDGGFVVVWVSEQQRSTATLPPVVTTVGNGNVVTNYSTGSQPENQLPHVSVDIYGRVYTSNGYPAINAFLVNTSSNVCANPDVSAASDNTFLVAWGEKNTGILNNSWDILERSFTLDSGVPTGGSTYLANTQLYGDQYGPHVSFSGSEYLILWTSLGQDESWEGVYGQFVGMDGSHKGDEFRVNTTTVNKQMHPALASDGAGRFLTTWTSYTGFVNSFDLYAQRYATTVAPLSPPPPPFVTTLSSNALSVTWAEPAGLEVANYEVYMDGASTPSAIVTNEAWNVTQLAAGSTHSFQLDYVLVDGRKSPRSDSASVPLMMC